MPGVLFIVATPIGNLEDITLRGLRILREVDLVACEDTRRTGLLLSRLEISGKHLLSCHEHNEAARIPELISRLQAGETVALVSDAGVPAVSDPGFPLIRAAIEAGVPVTPVPGPSALLTALAASGLPTDAFSFHGFLPAKQGRRRQALEALAGRPETLIFYEAPHRILALLDDVATVLGDRRVVVARELTKLHEELLRGRAKQVAAELAGREAIKGEIVLLVDRAAQAPATEPAVSLAERVAALIDQGVERMDAIKQAAKERGLSKREAYSRLERGE